MLWLQGTPSKPGDSRVPTSALGEKVAGDSVQNIQLDNAPPPQYMGSDEDKKDMLMLGRQQVLLVQTYKRVLIWKASVR